MLDSLPPPRTPGKGSSVYVPRGLYEQLRQLARLRRQKVSACATAILEVALRDVVGVKTAKAERRGTP